MGVFQAEIYNQQGGWCWRRIRIKAKSISSGADGIGEGSESKLNLYLAGRMELEKDQNQS